MTFYSETFTFSPFTLISSQNLTYLKTIFFLVTFFFSFTNSFNTLLLEQRGIWNSLMSPLFHYSNLCCHLFNFLFLIVLARKFIHFHNGLKLGCYKRYSWSKARHCNDVTVQIFGNTAAILSSFLSDYRNKIRDIPLMEKGNWISEENKTLLLTSSGKHRHLFI